MCYPRYTEELLKIIFLWIGILFTGFGVLVFFGIAGASENSMAQSRMELGIIYFTIGFAFLVVRTVLKSIVSSKVRQQDELLTSGTRVTGIVDKVYLQRFTQYGRKSPYRIAYFYVFQGMTYHHKTGLLWEKPVFAAQDSILVCANDRGESTVLLRS